MFFENVSRALQVNQQAIQTISHNLANVNTPGFSRQEVALRASLPLDTLQGSIGQGVDSAGIVRKDDLFVEQRLRNGLINQQSLASQAETLSQLESVFAPSSGDIPSTLSEFVQGLQELSVFPEDTGLRTDFITAAEQLVSSIRDVSRQFDEIGSQIHEKISVQVGEVNDLADQVAQLNREIAGAKNPNDLLDQRDQLLQQLSGVAGVRTLFDSLGNAQVFIDNQLLVDRNGVRPLEAVETAEGQAAVRLANAPQDLNVTGGTLGGLLSVQGQALAGAEERLSTFVASFTREINAIHSTGVGKNGGIESITAENAVADPTAALDSNGLAITSGSLEIAVRDQASGAVASATVAFDPSVDSLDDIAQQLNAIADINSSISQGKLVIEADAGFDFSFTSDTGGLLVGLEINTLFSGQTPRDIRVSDRISSDPNALALATGPAPGNNENALRLIETMGAAQSQLGDVDFSRFVGDMIGQVADEARSAGQQKQLADTAVENLQALRESISGVSIDEELVKLNDFQRSFQAQARVFQTLDETFGTILNLGV